MENGEQDEFPELSSLHSDIATTSSLLDPFAPTSQKVAKLSTISSSPSPSPKTNNTVGNGDDEHAFGLHFENVLSISTNSNAVPVIDFSSKDQSQKSANPVTSSLPSINTSKINDIINDEDDEVHRPGSTNTNQIADPSKYDKKEMEEIFVFKKTSTGVK